MPVLSNGRSVEMVGPPEGLKPTDKVFEVRFTGEIFTDYEMYLKRLDFYRRPQFSCRLTGKSRLTYEQALAEEQSVRRDVADNFPDLCWPALLRCVHYNQGSLASVTKEAAETLKSACLSRDCKVPMKKSIRTAIRMSCREREKWTGAPWIVLPEWLEKYSIEKEMPQELAKLIRERAERANKSDRRKHHSSSLAGSKQGSPSESAGIGGGGPGSNSERSSLSVTHAALIGTSATLFYNESRLSSLVPMSMKYPCKDEWLTLHGKLRLSELREFDDFFQRLFLVGCANPAFSQSVRNQRDSLDGTERSEQQKDDDHQTSESIPLYLNSDDNAKEEEELLDEVLQDFNSLNDSESTTQSLSNSPLPSSSSSKAKSDAQSAKGNAVSSRIDPRKEYLALNKVFHSVWKLWCFCNVFSTPLQLSPFTMSDLLAVLFHERKCKLWDEILRVMLESLRQCAYPSRDELENEEALGKKGNRGRKSGLGAAPRRSRRLTRQSKKSYKDSSSDESEPETETETDEDDEDSDEDRDDSSGISVSSTHSNDDDNSADSQSDSDDAKQTDVEMDDASMLQSQVDSAVLDERARLEAELKDGKSIMHESNCLDEYIEFRGHPAFNEDPILLFRLDILRDLVLYECERRKTRMKLQSIVDGLSAVSLVAKNSSEISSPLKSTIETKLEKSSQTSSDSMSEYSTNLMTNADQILCNEEIIAAVQNPRQFYTLGFWRKLDLLEFLFGALLRSGFVNRLVQYQINTKNDALKLISDEESKITKWIKERRMEMKEDRNVIRDRKDSLKKALKELDAQLKKKYLNKNEDNNNDENGKSGDVKMTQSSEKSQEINDESTTKLTSVPSLSNNSLMNVAAIVGAEYRMIEKQRVQIAELENEYKEKRDSVNVKHESDLRRLETRKRDLLANCAIRMKPLGMDRLYRRYYWNSYTAGHIFVLCPFSNFPSDVDCDTMKNMIPNDNDNDNDNDSDVLMIKTMEHRKKGLSELYFDQWRVTPLELLRVSHASSEIDPNQMDIDMNAVKSAASASAASSSSSLNSNCSLSSLSTMIPFNAAGMKKDDSLLLQYTSDIQRMKSNVSCMNPWHLALIEQSNESSLLFTKDHDSLDRNDEMKSSSVYENSKMVPTWQVISTTQQFYRLMDLLDIRGKREKRLHFMLSALKDEIVESMKLYNRDNYQLTHSLMNEDDLDHNNNNHTTQVESNGGRSLRRRSRRPKGGIAPQNSIDHFLKYKNAFCIG